MWALRRNIARMYVEMETFREHVRSRVYFRGATYLPLKINLSRSYIRDVSALGGVHTLNLRECTGISDVSALGGVHYLDLSGCTGISDVSALGGVHTLDLRGCTGISDVSARKINRIC